MNYSIHWTLMPESVRSNIISFLNHDFKLMDNALSLVQKLQDEMSKYKGYYTEDNRAIFESEAHYTMFLLRWS